MTDLPTLHLAREASRLGSDRELRRQREAGVMVSVATGVYVLREDLERLDPDAQYRLRVHAAALISKPTDQFSHDSAAALWRLPGIGAWSNAVHQVMQPQPGGRSRSGIKRHGLGLDAEASLIDGVLATSLARTVVDVAAASPFVRAVAMADRALRLGAGAADLDRAIEGRASHRSDGRIRRVIAFSSAGAESAGESLARVQFHALGLPAPELQVEFVDAQGQIGFADFYWPELDLIVEFDGQSKYGPGRKYQTKLSLEQMLLKEKAREDRLRCVVKGFARITWATAANRRLLADFLRPHGLIEGGYARRAPVSAKGASGGGRILPKVARDRELARETPSS